MLVLLLCCRFGGGTENFMADLGNAQSTMNIINKYQLRFQKKYGQNFLIDTHVLEKIMRAADIKKSDTVLEIGPGIGTMTQYLCESAKSVIAVEIDKHLIPVLSETLSAYGNVRVIEGDILKLDLEEILKDKENIKVVANLPYYITTPVIMKLFESTCPIESITVMVQKEVAERMKALPGTKDYGALSLAVNYYSKPYIAANVPANCFIPRPAVDSAVIRLLGHEMPPVSVKSPHHMFQLIRASFNQRRKTLANGIKNFAELSYSREEVEEALKACALPLDIRGEKLGLEEFAALSDALEKEKG